MCQAPFKATDTEWPDEIPLGHAAATMGGAWVRDDTRILLHTFDDVARRALVSWWKWLAARRQGNVAYKPPAD